MLCCVASVLLPVLYEENGKVDVDVDGADTHSHTPFVRLSSAPRNSKIELFVDHSVQRRCCMLLEYLCLEKFSFSSSRKGEAGC